MTSPLSPEAVAQMVADLTTKAAMINMGEKIAWGSDSGVMDAAADMITTLSAENATLRAEWDAMTERATDAELNWANCTRLAQRLRASEAAAMEALAEIGAVVTAIEGADSLDKEMIRNIRTRIAALSTPTTEPHGYVDGSATGVRDRDGRMICVGDRLRMDMKGDNTKQDYWYPEYEVYFKAPTFRLKHIGGDKDSDTAHWYFSTPQESSRMKTETIAVAASPAPQPAADTRVVVKPLVWEAYAQGEISRPNDVHPEYCTAPSVSKERAGEWRLRGPWIGFNYYPTKEAAKSAAQAHADAAHWKNTKIGGK